MFISFFRYLITDDHLSQTIALMAFIFYTYVSLIMHIWLLLTVVVKYLSIFHPVWLEFKNTDEEVIKYARIVVYTSAL